MTVMDEIERIRRERAEAERRSSEQRASWERRQAWNEENRNLPAQWEPSRLDRLRNRARAAPRQIGSALGNTAIAIFTPPARVQRRDASFQRRYPSRIDRAGARIKRAKREYRSAFGGSRKQRGVSFAWMFTGDLGGFGGGYAPPAPARRGRKRKASRGGPADDFMHFFR